MVRIDPQIAHAIKAAIQTAVPRKTITEVAGELGLTYDRLNNVCNGRTAASPALVESVRRLLALPADWLASAPPGSKDRKNQTAGATANEASTPKRGSRIDRSRRFTPLGSPMAPIPVVGGASAGPGDTYVDPESGVIWVPERLASIGRIAKIVDGDSMMPWLQPDDFAIFRERRSPRHRFAFLVRMPNGEDRIKITWWNGREFELRGLNPRYKPEPGDGVQIVAILVGWFRYRGTRETMDSDPDGLLPDYDLVEA